MKEYRVSINGIDHTMQLSDEDAKRLGATPVKAEASTKVRAPANKAKG